MSRYEVYRNADRVACAGVTAVADAVREAIARRGACFIALPGGAAPRALYEALRSADAADRVEWSRVHVFLTDERLVPPDHPESNARSLTQQLLDDVAVQESNRHFVATSLSPADAAAAYETEIAHLCGDDGFDIVVLGMGADGHVASLFAESAGLDESDRQVVAVSDVPSGTQRVSLTLSCIAKARRQLVLVGDAGCASAVTDARAGTARTPAGRLAELADADPVWLMDWPTATAMHASIDEGPEDASEDAVEALKKLAGAAAAKEVKSGMAVGLGTGSTARYVVETLGARWRLGELTDIKAVPTSQATEILARIERLPLVDLAAQPALDLTIDGADEISPDIDLIKGLGGALLREKIVAAASDRLAIVADRGKLVERLGTRAPVPVAVTPFGWQQHTVAVRDLGGQPDLRTGPDGEPYVTDDGMYILDCRFPDGLFDPVALDAELRTRVGIVETGLFLHMADSAFVTDALGVLVYRR